MNRCSSLFSYQKSYELCSFTFKPHTLSLKSRMHTCLALEESKERTKFIACFPWTDTEVI